MTDQGKNETEKDPPTPPPAAVREDPVTDPMPAAMAPPPPPPPEDPYPDLTRAQARTVRLIISIPVLTLLLTLSAGTVLYLYLMNLAESTGLAAETQSDLERAAIAILLLSIVFSLVAGVIGYILARQIVVPIKELMGRMEALAEGDFTMRVEPIKLGELGQLGSTFNRMVDQLNGLFEERDRQIRESFNGAHLVLDQNGVVLQADESARRVFGITGRELLGRNLLEVDAEISMVERNPRFLDTMARLIEKSLQGKPASRSVPVRGEKPGTEQRYFVSCTALEGDKDNEQRVLMEVRDISGMAGFYEQIQRADRLAAVGTLATGIAHEIRNPLASIRGMVQLLCEFGTEGTTPGGGNSSDEYLRRILSEVDRLDKLIAGVMSFANTDESPAEATDLNALLRDVEESARLRVGAGTEKVKVRWELDETLPDGRFQAGKLRQAFLNLIVNAYQHCVENGTEYLRIETVHLSVNPQRPLIVCISNPGSPIEDDVRERLFEPFYTTKASGTGLGLPIAYQTILSNGGVLELECEENEIQFWVRLPREAPTARSSSRLIPRLETPLPRASTTSQ